MADVYHVDLNDGHTPPASVSPLTYPSDVAECLDLLTGGYMKAAEDLLLNPGDFEGETASGNVVEVYPQEKEEGGESGRQRPEPRETRPWRFP